MSELKITTFCLKSIDSDLLHPFKEKRDSIKDIMEYINSDSNTRILAIFGLKRTGKSTLLKQAALALSENQRKKAVFIDCTDKTDFYEVINFINDKINSGFRYFFIDEITKANSFQGLATILSDDFVSNNGARIVVTGDYSLGLDLASRDLMYDKIKFVNTSHITFGEYKRLKDLCSIEDFIRHGSCLSDENFEDEVISQVYIDTAIVDNIINSLDKFEEVRRRSINLLTEKYEEFELKREIQNAINKNSIEAIIDAIDNACNAYDFKSQMNIEKIHEEIAKLLGCNRKTSVSSNDIKLIYDYLERIGVYTVIKQLIANDYTDLCIYSNPGLSYANLKYCLEYIKTRNDLFLNSNEAIKNSIVTKAYESVVDKVIENIVIGDVFELLCNRDTCINSNDNTGYHGCNRWYVGKAVKEIDRQRHKVDLIIKDNDKKECYLFEIKHSAKLHDEQAKHLLNEPFIEYISKVYGKVKGKYVLYCGQTELNHKIPRLNIEEFLLRIYKNKKEIVNENNLEKIITSS